ncbi:putative P-loop ATPase [Ruegeria denitrificans]|uniref:Putative P-loop ATPase n=1 Tax=Ruegeria denitrificans TaxID=1715692 RepID=A0A0P1I0V3_9RHOB|nr:VapE domain-containing protein [Ruegeria denitrificans]CUJ83723.1 putative P-loop ATPase [Ruegeria denitrificans]
MGNDKTVHGHLTTAYDAGFTQIVPLIPVGASLYPGNGHIFPPGDKYHIPPCDLDPSQMGKVPGILHGDAWGMRSGWTDYQITEADIATYDAAGSSCGLLGGDHWVGLDCDCMNPDLALEWFRALLARYPQMQVRIGQHPKFLVVFRVSGEAVPAMKIEFNKDGHAKQLIEIIGTGRQMVLLGDHPATGQPYKWYVGQDAATPQASRCLTLDTAGALELVELLEGIAKGLGWSRGRSRTTASGERNPLNDVPPDIDLAQDFLTACPNTLDGEEWYKLSYALRWDFGDDGWPLFLDYSRKWVGGQDTDRAIERQWKACARPDGSLAFGGTMHYLAEKHAADLPAGLIKRVRADTVKRKFDLAGAGAPTMPLGATAPATLPPGMTLPQSVEPDLDFITSTSGEILVRLQNFTLLLNNSEQTAGLVGRNLMDMRIYLLRPVPGSKTPKTTFTIRPIRDGDWVKLKMWFERQGVFRSVATEMVKDAITAVADENEFDPLADYLTNLPPPGYFGSVVSNWLVRYAGASTSPLTGDPADQTVHNAYLQTVGACWLISAVARALQPGCQADHALIFEGPQGGGKSTLFRTLAGDEFFSDSLPDFHSEKAPQHIMGKWIIEMSELTSVLKSELEDMRRFMTRRVERFKMPYDKFEIDYPRRCVIGGSTNRNDYLRDSQGERRFWIVQTPNPIDLIGLARDRDLIWADAVAMYRQGMVWYLTDPAVKDYALRIQRSRVAADPWEGVLRPYLEQRTEVTITDCLTTVGKEPQRQTVSDQNRVKAILELCGFKLDGRFNSGPNRNKLRYSKTSA